MHLRCPRCARCAACRGIRAAFCTSAPPEGGAEGPEAGTGEGEGLGAAAELLIGDDYQPIRRKAPRAGERGTRGGKEGGERVGLRRAGRCLAAFLEAAALDGFPASPAPP